MAIKAMTVQEALSKAGLKVMIYGRAGVGKTTLAKTMPRPILVLDFEGGILALMNEPEILVSPIQSISDLMLAVSELATDTHFRSVVFDGLSIFVKRRVQELRANRERVTWQEWQQLTNELRAAILPLLHLRKHILLTALSKLNTVRENGQEKIVGIQPDLTPALMRDVVAACDLVGLLVYDDPLFPEISARTVLFAPTNGLQIVSKSRIPNLTFSEPNFAAWLEFAQIPELELLTSSIAISMPEQKPQQEIQTEQPQREEESNSTQAEQQESDELTREIFGKARQLGLDNKAIGRIAREYFGQSFVRNLTVEQKRTLLSVLNKRLESQTPARKSESQIEPHTQPKATEEAETLQQEHTESVTNEFNSAISEFISTWRSVRGYDEQVPFEVDFAEIAVRNNWMPDELEAAISEVLLDKGFDFSSIPDSGYWLTFVPEALLAEVCALLRNR